MSNYLQIIFKCDLILQIFFLYFRGSGGPFLEGTYIDTNLYADTLVLMKKYCQISFFDQDYKDIEL